MIGNQIFFHPSVDSTNNYVAKGLETGQFVEGGVIMAGFQTQGRGQRGNYWRAEAGKNLLMSTALEIGFLHQKAYFRIAKAVSVAIISFLDDLGVDDAKIKWPNDILVSGQKLAGMLIETKVANRKTYAVIGIGLNTNQRKFEPDYKATSLSLELEREFRPKELCKQLSSLLDSQFLSMKSGHFEATESDYMRHLYGSNNFILFDEGSRQYRGRINSVGDDGMLLVKSLQGHYANYQSGAVKIVY